MIIACDKEQYITRGLAVAAIHAISVREGVSMHAYRCENCRQWHISTNGKNKRIKRKPNSITVTNFKIKKRYVPAYIKQGYFELATEKLISSEMAAFLKRLIEGRNHLEKQMCKR